MFGRIIFETQIIRGGACIPGVRISVSVIVFQIAHAGFVVPLTSGARAIPKVLVDTFPADLPWCRAAD